ncbi:two-component system, OmpR family, alkaline phosphatase synthesis response regulator PhoP [Desulfofundulus australicus DSM 11792]|uniref:Stage 0 sporulation protein A homolog n=1 Tax=Desulfofundulus australicus DSM 11792 TaxID=1121425 RepID=A0A1M5A154_9FIRM|nr:response regulator transcription factor [Desulfofundulus australicus]SHF24060.1 two-component system, OmpR family, alkaline phosphatase synthesis response regulator PhoP [Desulfofundulus australicus DSM 11792]
MAKILVVDDEEHILELIRFNLEKEGYQVVTATDGNTAVEIARSQRPDLILLDVMLPEQDGLAVCRILQQEAATRRIPVIMISARGDELDKVLGLEMGADDYVTKPFSPRELVARVKARLRRSGEDRRAHHRGGSLVRGRLVIDPERFLVTIDGVKQDLTPKEFELLRLLASEPGRVFSRDYLLEQIWGYDYTGDSRTVDVHIRHIRQKLEQVPGASRYIETVRGVGYRFREVP